jgi:hypothetical protein
MSTTASRARTDSRRRRLLAGGVAGNELLTASTGAVLLGLLAVEGLTIVFLGPLLVVHLVVGVMLVPPTLLKLGSSGYRFAHYYKRTPRYVRRGPPPLVLRLSAPVLVATTVAVLASGVVLLVAGPSSRDSVLPIHKVTFFVWLAAFGVHLLGHLPSLPRALRSDYGALVGVAPRHAGGEGRRMAVAVALVAAVVLAVVVAPDLPAWLDYHHVGRHR